MIYRYPGSKPFSTDEQKLFFGRDNDIQKFHELIDIEKMVLLYSKSGIGKSSLLNAGIIPQIKKAGIHKPVIIRFGAYTSESKDTPLSITIQRINKGLTVQKTFLDEIFPNENSLWYHFKQIQINNPEASNFIIIFDQFEELFTFPTVNVNLFKSQLADVLFTKIPQNFREEISHQSLTISDEDLAILYKPLEIKVVFSIRSDRMSLLNNLTDCIPNILQNYYELTSLSREQAQLAIEKPAQNSEFDFHSPAFSFHELGMKKMLDYLTKHNSQKVECSQLQILCHFIENFVIRTSDIFIEEHDLGNIEEIYEGYYDSLISAITNENEKRTARLFIENGLIYEPEERRLSLYEGQIKTQYNVNPQLLQKLVNTHILRAEPNIGGGICYELSNDTLVAPILKAKRARIEQEKIDEEENKRKRTQEKLEKELKQQQKIAHQSKILTYAIFIPMIVLASLAGYLFDKTLELEKNLRQLETIPKVKNNDSMYKAENQKNTSIIYELARLITLEKLGDRYFKLMQNKFDADKHEEAIELGKTLTELYNFKDDEIGPVHKAKLNGRIGYYMLFIENGINRSIINSQNALADDSTQFWINENLVLAFGLQGETEKAKAIYDQKLKGKSYEKANFKERINKSLMQLEEHKIPFSKDVFIEILGK